MKCDGLGPSPAMVRNPVTENSSHGLWGLSRRMVRSRPPHSERFERLGSGSETSGRRLMPAEVSSDAQYL